MKKEVVIIIAEDDDGHAELINKNLRRSGIANQILRFKDGQETLNFLLRKGSGPHRKKKTPYLLLLDIRMPKVDGIDILRKIKEDDELCKLPVIMITTTDDPREVKNCHYLGCNSYITKPVDYDKFVEAIRRLGYFLMVVEIPEVNGNTL